MSSRNHSAAAHEITHLVQELSKLTEEEIENLHGIELKTDGTVWDPTYNMKFDTVGDWATFTIGEDDVEFKEQFHNDVAYYE